METMRAKPDDTKSPFHATAEAHRANHSHLVWWRAIAVLTLPWAMLSTAWAVYEIKTDPKIEKAFLLVDEATGRLYGTMVRELELDDLDYAAVAEQWIAYIRTRPREDYAAVGLRKRAARLTAKDSQAAIETEVMIKEIDTKLRHPENKNETELSLEVRDGMELAVLGRDEETKAVAVHVAWQERTQDELGNKGPWEHRYMVLQVQKREQTSSAEVQANLTGLYVTGITKLGLGRPANYKTAAAQ